MGPDSAKEKKGAVRRLAGSRSAQRWFRGQAPVKPGLRAWPLLLLALAVGACEDDGSAPPNLRFGQLGEVRVRVQAPLALGTGELQQALTWTSNGAWRLRESVSYRGLTGDEHVIRPEGDPGAFASAYASLITQINETRGLELFIESLSSTLEPRCEPPRSTIMFRIRDDARDEEVSWTRCVVGTLTNMDPSRAGPDPDASRVVVAGALARDFTLGPAFTLAYRGTIPFGTLDRGESSGAELEGPRSFRSEASDASQPPAGWLQFWATHAGGTEAPPQVDWEDEMVVVAAVGQRFEAGDSVEVRRIVTVGSGAQAETVVEYLERIPGDFCSPAARTQHPFHIVVAPRTEGPIRFSQLATERVPCGF